MTDPAIQSRLSYQEKVSEDLSKQLKAVKSLLHNEVTELKSSLSQQMIEIKQIVMHQDRLYQERIRRLENRVEQISEFSLHLARTKGVGAVTTSNLDGGLLGNEGGDENTESKVQNKSSFVAAEPPANEEEEDIERLPGVRGVLQRYKNRIRNVYIFYTSYQASRPLAQVMDMTQFTRLVRDCGICQSLTADASHTSGSHQLPEILWMTVMRRLQKRILRFHKEHPFLGKLPVAMDANTPLNRFSIERHLDLPLEFFPEALVVLSEVKYGKDRVDMTQEQALERFLNSDIFANVDMRLTEDCSATVLDSQRQLSSAVTNGSTLDAALIQDYAKDEVKEEFKPYISKIKATYMAYVKRPANIALAGRMKDPDAVPNMFLETFVDVVKEHGLFPFITKADIRIIYNTARKSGPAKEADAEESRGRRGRSAPTAKPVAHSITETDEGLSIAQFKVALKYLAELIYGAKVYQEKYHTPALRIKKMLSKMYLLTNM